ncbi:trehalose-phosphatase [Erythrobacter sp. SD-21]|uniref:trehalose-phosphatase n=1 Tax=Erythrobacter sp. SD-21 TaxID=161528 RepID=UPI000153FAA7|nr:trehalose-phosphatase [Erythrobacter sp. SD-21]EDL48129.1 Trehalose-phosphatase [Erythrobacter sp. SD-21]
MASRTPLPFPPSLAQLLDSGPHSLFLDFDGTLVGIAPRPGDIDVPDDLSGRLHHLQTRLEGRLALVSGRSLDDLESHIGGVSIARAGSHGASRFCADGSRLGAAPSGLPDEAVAELRTFAQDHALFYETKSHGGALHFRGMPEKGEVTLAFARQVAEQFGLEVTSGKGVAELVRPGANKGAALQAFMAIGPFAGSTPVFVGDDVTDEDGMRAAIEFAGFGIAVGERESKAARYHLETVSAVHHWLDI